MKFKATVEFKGKVKKRKEYTFPDLTEEDKQEGLKRTLDNPLLIKRGGHVFELCSNVKGKLIIYLHHCCTEFEEIEEGKA